MDTIVINLDGRRLYYTTGNYTMDDNFISFIDNKGIEKKFSKRNVEEISKDGSRNT